MTTFNINLVSSDVLPRRQRSMLFWAMVVYLLVCGTILALIAYHTTRSLARTLGERVVVLRSEAGFKQLFSTAGDIDSRLAELKTQLDEECMRLTIIDGILQHRANISVILSGLSRGLPQGFYILNVGMKEKKGTITFELVIPVGESIGSPNTSELIAHWRANRPLMREVSTIKSLVSERQRIDGKTVFMLKFECQIQKGQG